MLGQVDFRRLFEAAPDLYLVLDPDLRVVAVTDAYAQATMIDRDQVVGHGIFEIFPDNPDDTAAEGARNLRVSLERVLRGGVTDAMAVQRYDIRQPDGSFEQRFWSPSNSPIRDSRGRLRYIVHRVEDVTEFMRLQAAEAAQQQETAHLHAATERMEQEVFTRAHEVAETSRRLKETNAELTELYARTKELDELKSQFFANVSHELRTPLTLILTPAQQLLDAVPDQDPARGGLEMIIRNAQILLRQVNNLLDASRLEAGAVRPDYTRVDIAEQARLSTAFFESVALDRSTEFVVDTRSAIAELDPEHLQRILVNLLSNAFKYTGTNGIVRCAVRPERGHVVIEVADSGPGIPAAHRDAVFDRFRQLDGGVARSTPGTGLGLSIVRDLVRLHRGDIRITDAPEGGALVTIDLPISAPAGTPVRAGADAESAPQPTTAGEALAEFTPTAPAPAPAPDLEYTGETAKPVVVVIEDNPDLNALLRRTLSARYCVLAAHDGRDGLDLARRHRPDLLVCDLMMPNMAGDELLTRVRADPTLTNTPVLILSARADDRSRLALLRVGANDYLPKPFDVTELQARVDNLVNLRLAESRLRTLRIAGERERIALELHRTVVHRLFALSLQLSGTRPLIRVGAVADRLDAAVTELDAVIDQIRLTINELDTPTTSADLCVRLSGLIGDTAETLGVHSATTFRGRFDTLDDTLGDALHDAAHHLVATIARRHPDKIALTADLDDRELTLTITETTTAGTVIPPPSAGDTDLLPPVLTARHATLEVTVAPPGDTTWTWRVPIQQPAPT
ncbi:ATP-binding protein [Nocardia sp. R6R-6]|uniref:ATP-binding protein n=1 Tax=Nocardia sp. R6R-6 TaxID=3459303 RepID=UPI00403D9FC6